MMTAASRGGHTASGSLTQLSSEALDITALFPKDAYSDGIENCQEILEAREDCKARRDGGFVGLCSGVEGFCPAPFGSGQGLGRIGAAPFASSPSLGFRYARPIADEPDGSTEAKSDVCGNDWRRARARESTTIARAPALKAEPREDEQFL